MSSGRVRKALIPAAGRGTRFLPLTKSVPKELAPIVTTPALEFVVAEAAQAGITDVILVVSAAKVGITEYFQPNEDLEAALEAKGDKDGLALVRRPVELATVTSVEQEAPRGLGDAVSYGEQFAAGEPIAVLLPDDLVDERDDLLGAMLDVYDKHGGVVVALLDVGREEISKYGSVVPAEGADLSADLVPIVDMVEKPKPEDAPSTLAIIGRYVLPPEIFDALRTTEPGSGGEIQLTDAMKQLCHSGTPVHGVVFRGRRYDTGDRLDYVKAVVQFAVRHPDIGDDFRAWLGEYVAE
ncbi:MAG: UTP--glucose-phosphate uridylyltransferase [Pseudonocardiales bacterium]|jgi:UTP--glucose-1-phosphate uridylyltransferase|nr:UTP--glucose-phosphate uridylyltransferase [Pseudonocardiales bacterium]MDT4920358.1 UTP--glucose-phosphate uridylyltransferase [Pseudonocardiales bacterium]MDT4942779.1 UTP--glucose-phosphate uridylyltransferase [Pseudonocardiales bacterium]